MRVCAQTDIPSRVYSHLMPNAPEVVLVPCYPDLIKWSVKMNNQMRNSMPLKPCELRSLLLLHNAGQIIFTNIKQWPLTKNIRVLEKSFFTCFRTQYVNTETCTHTHTCTHCDQHKNNKQMQTKLDCLLVVLASLLAVLLSHELCVCVCVSNMS